MKYKGSPTLVAHLHTYLNYAVNYHNMKLVHKLSMNISKVHRVRSYTQSCWMDSFIRYNANVIRALDMTLNNDFYTLVNTATYGQPMKRVRDRVEIKMTTGSQITTINLMVQDPQIQEP